MSDEETNKETTIVSEEVSVTKRLELEEFDDPVIAFDIESRRDERATVTVVDGIPDNVSPRDLRFHPEYGSEHWVIDDGELVFEREFDPGEDYITVYRLCDAKEDIVESFEDPTVEADPGIEAPEGAGKARGMVRSAGTTAGTANGGPAAESEPEEESEDDDVPTLKLNDPVADDGTDEEQSQPAEDRTTTVMTDTASETSGGDSEHSAESEPDDDLLSEDDDILSDGEDDVLEEGEDDILSEGGDDILAESEDDGRDEDEEDAEQAESGADIGSAEESLVAALAAELEEGNVPEEDVERLRNALGQPHGERKSVVVRVEKLQRDVDEVLAYTDALAEFLDENGTGEELITDFQEEVDDFREEMERFEADLDEVASATDRTEGRVDDLETEVEDSFEEVREDLGALRTEVEAVHDELEDGHVAERLSELEENVDNLRDWRGRLAQVLQEPDP
ncbi:MAG: hypothetical protein V5A13_04165 [Haloarculaceae archaeon]